MVGLTLVGLLGASYVLSSTILMNGFRRVEENSVRLNLSRVTEALSDRLSTLESINTDWSNWDDTCTFIEDGNAQFIKTNLTNNIFPDLKFNLIIMLDSSGRAVFSRAYDITKRRAVPVPPDMIKHLSYKGLLTKIPGDNRKGLISLSTGPMLIASQPILTSEGLGPARGTLIMGRYLDAQEIDLLVQKTRLKIAVCRFDDQEMPHDFSRARRIFSEENSEVVQPLNGEYVAGYTALKDIYRKPVFILRIVTPRSVFKQGQTTISYLLISLLGTGLIFGLVSLVLLEKQVLWRLLCLSKDVSRIGATEEFVGRVSVGGNDELTGLGQDINGMLQALDNVQDKLRQANLELEERVQQRTSELAQANVSLRGEIVVRKKAEEALQEANELLELRVRQRTAELAESNEQLVNEVEERKRAQEEVRQAFTKLKQAQEDLLRAERLATVGETSGRVAHEVLNPLTGIFAKVESNVGRWQDFRKMLSHMGTVISDWYNEYRSGGFSGYLSTKDADGMPYGDLDFKLLNTILEKLNVFEQQREDDLKFMQKQLQRVTRIINSLRESARTQRSITYVDISVPIREALELMEDSLQKKGIEIESFIPKEIPPVMADESEMVQVFTNLYRNAIQSMEEKGQKGGTLGTAVSIKTDRIEIRIKDTGTGIPEAVRDSIFDPNFSTKDRERGTGFGLGISRRFVRSSGGDLLLEESFEGKGSTFLIVLPFGQKDGPT